jgi:hypothetical protein
MIQVVIEMEETAPLDDDDDDEFEDDDDEDDGCEQERRA